MARGRPNKLERRLLSAAVLAVPALAATIWGGPYFPLLVLLFGLAMAWEWDRLCGGGTFAASGAALMLAVAAALLAAATQHVTAALTAAFLGALAVYAVARLAARPDPARAAMGALYIGVPVVALIWLRGEGAAGRDLVLWLFAVVWATDAGAYACGRLVGGPRLAPRISPNKTWAGAFGGVAAAMLVSAAASLAAPSDPARLIAFGVVLSVAAQAGDLLESAVKRHFGVKDVSGLIPGHGGVFDRVDGLLVAAPVAAGLIWATDGGVHPWR